AAGADPLALVAVADPGVRRDRRRLGVLGDGPAERVRGSPPRAGDREPADDARSGRQGPRPPAERPGGAARAPDRDEMEQERDAGRPGDETDRGRAARRGSPPPGGARGARLAGPALHDRTEDD